MPFIEAVSKCSSAVLSGTLTTGGKSKGLILDVGGYYKNVFTMAPSLYITEKEIDTAMNGNVCRCGTYMRIKEAIHLAADGGRRA